MALVTKGNKGVLPEPETNVDFKFGLSLGFPLKRCFALHRFSPLHIAFCAFAKTMLKILTIVFKNKHAFVCGGGRVGAWELSSHSKRMDVWVRLS